MVAPKKERSGPVRKRGKATTLPSAPAFGFGSAARMPGSRDEPGPGPGEYFNTNPTKFSQHKRAATPSFGSSIRSKQKEDETPGPEYDPSKKQTNKAPPAITLSPYKPVFKDTECVPGPGTYNTIAENSRTRKHINAPAYSLTARNGGIIDRERRPGPAAYFPPKESLAPAYSMTFKHEKEQRDDDGKTAPGPGAYTPEDVGRRRDAARHSIPHAIRAELKSPMANNPGPGEYGAPKRGAMRPQTSQSIGREHRMGPPPSDHPADTPGPGTYRDHVSLRQVSSQHRSCPGIPMAGKPLARDGISETPGPDYNPEVAPTRGSTPAYTFRGVAPLPADAPGFGNVPAPGAYDSMRGKRFTMYRHPTPVLGARCPPPVDRGRTPGPSDYGSPYLAGARRSVSASMKFRHPPPGAERAATAPGPAHYRPEAAPRRTGTPAYTFRKKLWYHKDESLGPGPAGYDVASPTLGNWGFAT